MASNTARKESSPRPSGVQFVNMIPAMQAEKKQNRRIIRSAAMKSFRKNQRLARVGKETEHEKGLASEKSEKQNFSSRPCNHLESETALLWRWWNGGLASPSRILRDSSDGMPGTITHNTTWSSWSQSKHVTFDVSQSDTCI